MGDRTERGDYSDNEPIYVETPESSQSAVVTTRNGNIGLNILTPDPRVTPCQVRLLRVSSHSLITPKMTDEKISSMGMCHTADRARRSRKVSSLKLCRSDEGKCREAKIKKYSKQAGKFY